METINGKAYELRDLKADDIFPMFNILSKVGIKELRTCFESPEVKDVISKTTKGEEVDASSVGMVVVIDMAGILMANIHKAKDDIYIFCLRFPDFQKRKYPKCQFLNSQI